MARVSTNGNKPDQHDGRSKKRLTPILNHRKSKNKAKKTVRFDLQRKGSRGSVMRKYVDEFFLQHSKGIDGRCLKTQSCINITETFQRNCKSSVSAKCLLKPFSHLSTNCNTNSDSLYCNTPVPIDLVRVRSMADVDSSFYNQKDLGKLSKNWSVFGGYKPIACRSILNIGKPNDKNSSHQSNQTQCQYTSLDGDFEVEIDTVFSPVHSVTSLIQDMSKVTMGSSTGETNRSLHNGNILGRRHPDGSEVNRQQMQLLFPRTMEDVDARKKTFPVCKSSNSNNNANNKDCCNSEYDYEVVHAESGFFSDVDLDGHFHAPSITSDCRGRVEESVLGGLDDCGCGVSNSSTVDEGFSTVCPILNCDVCFDDQDKFKSHLYQLHHSPCNPLATLPNGVLPPETSFLCPLCGMDFQEREMCHTHMLTSNHLPLMSPVPFRVFACPQCFSFFASFRLTREHMDNLAHHSPALCFKDDITESKEAVPIAVPNRVMDLVTRMCRQVPLSLLSLVDGTAVTSVDQLIVAMNAEALVSAQCSKTITDVLATLVTDQSCAECRQMIVGSSPSTLSFHTSCPMNGPVLSSEPRSMSSFIRRCGITDTSTFNEHGYACDSSERTGGLMPLQANDLSCITVPQSSHMDNVRLSDTNCSQQNIQHRGGFPKHLHSIHPYCNNDLSDNQEEEPTLTRRHTSPFEVDSICSASSCFVDGLDSSHNDRFVTCSERPLRIYSRASETTFTNSSLSDSSPSDSHTGPTLRPLENQEDSANHPRFILLQTDFSLNDLACSANSECEDDVMSNQLPHSLRASERYEDRQINNNKLPDAEDLNKHGTGSSNSNMFFPLYLHWEKRQVLPDSLSEYKRGYFTATQGHGRCRKMPEATSSAKVGESLRKHNYYADLLHIQNKRVAKRKSRCTNDGDDCVGNGDEGDIDNVEWIRWEKVYQNASLMQPFEHVWKHILFRQKSPEFSYRIVSRKRDFTTKHFSKVFIIESVSDTMDDGGTETGSGLNVNETKLWDAVDVTKNNNRGRTSSLSEARVVNAMETDGNGNGSRDEKSSHLRQSESPRPHFETCTGVLERDKKTTDRSSLWKEDQLEGFLGFGKQNDSISDRILNGECRLLAKRNKHVFRLKNPIHSMHTIPARCEPFGPQQRQDLGNTTASSSVAPEVKGVPLCGESATQNCPQHNKSQCTCLKPLPLLSHGSNRVNEDIKKYGEN